MAIRKEPTIEALIQSKLILVEGKDDKDFLIEYGKHLGINNCRVESVDSVNNFIKEIPSQVKRTGFEKITHFAIIRDKDTGTIEDAFTSIINIFKKKTSVSDFPKEHGQWSEGKPKIGVFIMPGKQEGIMLEDLCLSTVASKPEMKCVNEFSNCISQTKNMAKTKTLAYLAAQYEPVNTIGLGASKGYWDFEAPVLGELNFFLSILK